MADPKAAEALARTKSPDAAFIAQVIAETGASLPADDAWVSPWTSAKPAPAKAKAKAKRKPAAKRKSST